MQNSIQSSRSAIEVRTFPPVRPAFLTLLLVLLLSDSGIAQRPKTGPSRVVVGNVIKSTRASEQSFVGTLQATRKAIVGSAVDGRVIKVDFDAGDPVGAEPNSSPDSFVGQKLVELRTNTLDIELRAAEIQVELAQQAFDELKLSLPQQLEFANANLSGAESQFEYAKKNYLRSRSLQQKSGAISKLELEESRSLYLASQQAVIGARSEVQSLSSTKELQLAQAKSRVEAAQQASLRLKDLRDQYTIRAPFEGVVISKLTEVGQWVTRGSPIVEIVQLDPIEMIVNVPQEFSGRLQDSLSQSKEKKELLGVQVEITGLEGKLKGEVVRVIPQADLRSRSFPVRIRIENPKTGDVFKLQPGMLGRAKMMVGRETEMILVNKDALVLGQRGDKVLKVTKQGGKTIAIPVEVTTGANVGGWIQVSGDVSEKDQVVIVGNERLKPGAEIEISETRVGKIEE